MKISIYNPFQKEKIANAIENLPNVDFEVDYEWYSVRCYYDKKDDEIAAAVRGYLGAFWYKNTAEGRSEMLNDLRDYWIRVNRS